jgi:hypothetical protein
MQTAPFLLARGDIQSEAAPILLGCSHAVGTNMMHKKIRICWHQQTP